MRAVIALGIVFLGICAVITKIALIVAIPVLLVYGCLHMVGG